MFIPWWAIIVIIIILISVARYFGDALGDLANRVDDLEDKIGENDDDLDTFDS